MAGRDEKSLPGMPTPHLSHKAAILAAWEEIREREKQMPEAPYKDLEELKAAILGYEEGKWQRLKRASFAGANWTYGGESIQTAWKGHT